MGVNAANCPKFSVIWVSSVSPWKFCAKGSNGDKEEHQLRFCRLFFVSAEAEAP